MTTDTELLRLATKVGAYLLDSERRLVTAESCTGGWIGSWQLSLVSGRRGLL
jgi:nicotinamide-nucleotide amidase